MVPEYPFIIFGDNPELQQPEKRVLRKNSEKRCTLVFTAPALKMICYQLQLLIKQSGKTNFKNDCPAFFAFYFFKSACPAFSWCFFHICPNNPGHPKFDKLNK
jgi:hypothetical protein